MGSTKRIMAAKANALWHKILRQGPKELASHVKEAAKECHTAISKLALRDDVDTARLEEFQKEISSMLNALRQIIGRLTAEDAKVKELFAYRAVKRYIELMKTLDDRSKPLLAHRRCLLEQERDAVLKDASKTLKQIRAMLQECLIFRLEIIRYWKAFLWKAIEIYACFRDVLRESLRTISGQISDKALRAVVAEALSDEEVFRIESFTSVREELGSNPTDIDRQAIRELEELCEVETKYEEIRTSAVELEHSDALLHEEIERSEAESASDQSLLLERAVIHRIDLLDEEEKPKNLGKVFSLSRSRE